MSWAGGGRGVFEFLSLVMCVVSWADTARDRRAGQAGVKGAWLRRFEGLLSC